MILKIENPKRLLPKRKHIKLESLTIDGKEIPIDKIIFREDEIEIEGE